MNSSTTTLMTTQMAFRLIQVKNGCNRHNTKTTVKAKSTFTLWDTAVCVYRLQRVQQSCGYEHKVMNQN